MESSLISDVNISHLLRVNVQEDGSKSNTTIVSASLLADGIPVLTTSNQETFSYHLKLKSWVQVGDSKPLVFQVGKGLADSLSYVEQGHGNILSVSQIEEHLACSLHLRSVREYRYWLKLYARRLSDEVATSKIEELCYSLLGPSTLGQASKDWEPLLLVCTYLT